MIAMFSLFLICTGCFLQLLYFFRRRHLDHRPVFRRADIETCTTLDAFILQDSFPPRALIRDDGLRRTGEDAMIARPLALLRHDLIGDELPADQGRASLLLYMCLVLVAKVA